MGDVRARYVEPKPAGVHCDVSGRIPDPGIAELAERIPAGDLPGDVHQYETSGDREADRVYQEQVSIPGRATATARFVARVERGTCQTPGAGCAVRGADSVVRA